MLENIWSTIFEMYQAPFFYSIVIIEEMKSYPYSNKGTNVFNYQVELQTFWHIS